MQKKAARYVLNDYNNIIPGAVSNMVNTLQWKTHASRRIKARLTYCTKLNGGM